MIHQIRSQIIDAFHKIECRDERVIRIKANHQVADLIRDCFASDIDKTQSSFGTLFGALICLDADLRNVVLLEGEFGAIITIHLENLETKKQSNIEQDTKRKFRFILEEK